MLLVLREDPQVLQVAYEGASGQALQARTSSQGAESQHKSGCWRGIQTTQVRLGPQTRKVSCSLDIGSDLTIASPELKDFSQDIEENQVCFSGAGSHGTSRESGTLSIKLGFAQWKKLWLTLQGFLRALTCFSE